MAIALSGSLVITGSIFATQGITGSFSGSATSASYADTLQGLGSASFAPAGTFNIVSSSYATTSGSLSTRVTNLESTSSTVSSSFASTSGSIAGRVTLIEGQYATTGSNNFTGIQHITSTVNPLTFNTSASLYTDGGLLVTKDSFVSGTAYFNNVVVYGTSSIQYLTSSQINIGASYINLNTNLPAQRYGGMTVADSGSNAGVTGSLLWDSVNNGWIYSRESGSTYRGGALISGPRTQVQGSEQTTTACYIMAGQGGDHITASQIYHDSNATCFYNGNAYINSSGAACFSNSVTGSSTNGIGGLFTSNTFFGSIDVQNTGGDVAGRWNVQSVSGTQVGGSAGSSFGIYSYGASAYRLFINCSGNVGIGTISPAYKIDVNGTVATNDGFYSSKGGSDSVAAGSYLQLSNQGIIQANASSGVDFWTLSGTWQRRMTIAQAGNVAIGTTCFYNGANFVVSAGSAASSSPYMGIFNCTTSPTVDASVRLDLGFLGGTSNYVATGGCLGFINFMGQANDAGYGGPGIITVITCGGNTGRSNHAVDTVFTTKSPGNTGSTEKMRITSAGCVGIGTAGPDAVLHVYCAAGSANALLAHFQNGGGGTAIATIKIGEGTPESQYGVLGHYGADNSFRIGSINGGLYFHAGASTACGTNLYGMCERVAILTNGNVGIGTISPYTKLDIRGTSASAAATLQIVGNSVSTLLLGQNSSGGVIRGQGGSDALSFWTGGSGDTGAGSSGTEKMRITSIGTLKMAATTISNNNATFGATDNGGYQYFQGDLANGEKFGSQGGTYIQGFYFISWYSTSGRGYAIYATVSPAANAGTVLASSGGWAAASATYNASSAISLAFDGSGRGPVLSNNTGTTVTFYSYVFGGI